MTPDQTIRFLVGLWILFHVLGLAFLFVGVFALDAIAREAERSRVHLSNVLCMLCRRWHEEECPLAKGGASCPTE